ncbi:MAG: dihydroorotate dehydrogenase-like protein [Actinomycetota bacterium]
MSADLTTRYLGLELSGPVMASAGPLTGTLDGLRALQDAGAAAVVLPSLFEEDVIEEELQLADLLDDGEEFPEFASAPLSDAAADYVLGPERHVRLVERAKATLSVPVIASVNAAHAGSWERYATLLEEAGADAIELNMYSVAANAHESAAEVEARKLEIVSAVREAVGVPLAVKLSPFYTSVSHFAAAVVEHGADGLVLFNRFYAPDIDLGTLTVQPALTLSESDDLRLPLRWLGILRPQLPRTSLAATSGVHSGGDVVKALLVGADVACTTSSVLRRGPGHVATMLAEVQAWLDANEYSSVRQLTGSMSAASVPDPAGFERAQYRAIVTTLGR